MKCALEPLTGAKLIEGEVMNEISHRTIETNGIRMHVTEKGAGPLVILCHGFPESWYSWRHQIEALSAAGFHTVAPDMRGYGQTESPQAIDQFTLLHLVGDVIALLDALGVETAVIAGHDWGAPVAWHAALLRPDRFRAVIGLSVPFRPRSPVRPSSVMPQTDDAVFYQQYFQSPGVAEEELEHDVRASIRSVLLSLAGEAPARPDGAVAADNFSMVPREGGLLGRITQDARHPAALPGWITDADIDFYAGEFLRTGFRGGLNWYRNIDRNWELLSPFAGARVTIPALYVAGERDLVLGFPGARDFLANLPKFVPQLSKTMILPGCGHWTQQERPREVNEAMIAFLNSL
jgi:pimeloyl-ACP methyl ester carboxylesterase